MARKILNDLYYASGKSYGLKAVIKTILFRRGFHTLILYRIACALNRIPIIGYLLARLVWSINCTVYGNDISFHAKLNGGIILPHPLGIVIGDNVIVEQGVTILQNVTLGARDAHASIENRYKLHLKENSFIGAGAVVLGSITIGKNTRIGANSVVLNSVKDNQSVVGVPAKCLK